MNKKINKFLFSFVALLYVDVAIATEYKEVASVIKHCEDKVNYCVQVKDLNFQLPDQNSYGKLVVFSDGSNYIVQLSQEPDIDYPSYRLFVYRVVDGVVVNVMSRWSWDFVSLKDVNGDGVFDVVAYENPFGISDPRIYKWPILIDGVSFIKTFNLVDSKIFLKDFIDKFSNSISILENECKNVDKDCLYNISRSKLQLKHFLEIYDMKSNGV